MGFNSRSRGGSDQFRHALLFVVSSFNSRSRGGSDPSRSAKATSPHVSIHAPAGGAT